MTAKRVRALLLVVMAWLCLAACASAMPAVSTPVPPATAVAVSTFAVTTLVTEVPLPVIKSTSPANATLPPFPTPVSPTIIPTLPTNVSAAELKYLVLAQYPNLFFCDPDYYPVARANEADLARQHFGELQAATDEFRAILGHNGLTGLTTFTDDQKLLIYREHKRLAAISLTPSDSAYQFQLRIKDNNQQGFLINGRIDNLGSITVEERLPTIATCPICLAGHTQIDTPLGPVAVEDLRPGDVVWTRDAHGTRQAAPLLETIRVPVPNHHQMAHVVLDDGRELWASPAHPTMENQPVGSLEIGDWLDGARVSRLEFVPYDQPATYDLLPAGETGFYWANGILIGSTLAHARP